MSQDLVKIIKDSEVRIKSVIRSIEDDLSNIDSLTAQEIIDLNEDLKESKAVMHKIKETCKKISSKVNTLIALKDPKLKSKLKDKKSFEFNNVLLHQGKPAKALDNIEEKAKKGDLNSQFLIGRTYLNGVIGYYGDVKMKDVGLGLKWLTVAYKNGHQESGFLIASYEKSVLNTENAIKLFEKMGENGHIESLNELLHIYSEDPKHENMERVLEIKYAISKM